MDHLHHGGAQILAGRIRSYWAERGIEVETTLEPMTTALWSGDGNNRAVWCVRSNLNGTERDELPAKAA